MVNQISDRVAHNAPFSENKTIGRHKQQRGLTKSISRERDDLFRFALSRVNMERSNEAVKRYSATMTDTQIAISPN